MEQWAELRREHFVRGVSIKQLASRTGLSRNTVRAALRASQPPRYQRAPPGSKLDSFKDEIHRLLKDDCALPGQRIRELIAPLVFDSWTASRLKASEYGGVLGIDRHPLRPAKRLSRQVSTKAGELQFSPYGWWLAVRRDGSIDQAIAKPNSRSRS